MVNARLAPLRALSRLRHIGVAEARRVLVAQFDAQTCADRKVSEIEWQMAREARAAADPMLGDSRVEAYGRWLILMRHEASALAADRVRTHNETTIARARLAAARAAAIAVDTVVDRYEAAAEADSARQEQTIVDELTRSRRSPG